MAELPKGFVRESELETNQQQQEQPPTPQPSGENGLPRGFVKQSDLESPEQQPQTDSTFSERIGNLREQRIDEVSKTFEDYSRGDIGLGSMLLQTVGKGGFGAANDLLGESFTTVLSKAVPDAIEDPIKQYVADFIGDAYNSKIGQKVKEEWDKLDPETQKNLQSGGNIMAWATPKIKAGDIGDNIKGLGNAVKKERMAKKLKLPDTPSNKLAEAKRQFRDPYGFDEVVEATTSVKGISPNNSNKKNIQALGQEIERLDKELFKSLRQKSRDVESEFIEDAIDLHLSTLLKNNQWIQADSAISKAFDDNVKAMNKILNRFPDTPQGMIRARREFDKMLKEDMLRVPESELIARDAVSKSLRRALNDVAQRAAPSAPVKETLQKQSKLYSALDNMAENYKLETPPLTEIKSLANRHPALAVGLASGTGAGAVMLANPVTLGAAGAGVGLWGAYKGYPTALRGAGGAISAAGRATDLGSLPNAAAGLDRLPVLRSGVFAGKEEEEERKPIQIEIRK